MGKARTFKFDHNGEGIVVIYDGRSYELYVNGVLQDQRGGLFAVPIIGGTGLRGVGSQGERIDVFIRNMGVFFRIEVEYQGHLAATKNFF